MTFITKTSGRTRQRGLSLLVWFSLKPWVPCASFLASSLFSRISGSAAAEPTLVNVFSLSTQVPLVSRIASTTLMRFFALLRPSFAFPDPVLVPVPVSILVPVPISATALVSAPTSVPVTIPAPSTLPSPFHLAFFRSRLPLLSFPLRPHPHYRSRPRSRPRLRSRLRSRPPDSDLAPDPIRSFPSLGPGHPLGTMRVYRHRALRTELSGSCKRRLLSAETMTRAE